MFGNAYQNGPHVQVFDSKVNNEKNQFYKQLYRIHPNTIKRQFDKEVKSFLYDFEGLNARITFPNDDHKELSLQQRFLVLQIHIPIGSAWSMEIVMTDISKTKRRINLTTTPGKQQIKYFFFKYPINFLQRGIWLFLGIDVLSFMEVFKGQVFRSLDHIVVGSHCRLRRIFTMKQWNQWDIPKSYWLPGQVQQSMQLIEYGEKKIDALMIMSMPQQDVSRVKETPKKSKKEDSVRGSVRNTKSPNQLRKREDIFKKSPDKFAINGTKSLIRNGMTKSQIVPEIKSKMRLNTMADKQQSIFRKSKQKEKDKQRSISKSKAPILQKSFEQDQAFMVPAQDSDIPYAESHESRESELVKYQIIQEDKWSDEDVAKTISTPFTEQMKNMSNGFPTTTITKQNNRTVILEVKKQNQLQLIYDEMVGCYYHPETNTYYEIDQ